MQDAPKPRTTARHSLRSRLQLLDRLAELPLLALPPARTRVATWPLTAAERARVRIAWPATFQWAAAAQMTETIKHSLASLGVLHVGNMAQHHRGVVSLRCEIDGRSHLVAIDYADRPQYVNDAALAECGVYFKLQYQERGYRDSRIVPGGYPVCGLHYYQCHRALRGWYRHRPRIDVLGRFSYEFQRELRARAVEMLSAAPDIRYVGAGPRARPSRFLREAASARLALDLPGNGPFTYRVAEFLGLGTCLVAPRYTTSLHVSLVPGVHYVPVADDLSDLVSVCRYYLAHEHERAAIARAGRIFFDRYLHADHLAAYYVRTILDRCDSGAEHVRLLNEAPFHQDHRAGVAEVDLSHG